MNSISEAYTKLESAIENINDNKEWQSFLAFQARFYEYSFQNTLLIYDQNPSASFVNGFNSWKKLGRHVKKGEKAIKIFAPCKYKDDEEENAFVIRGFKLVSVFDLEQTEGDDSQIPVLVSGLKTTAANAANIYEKLLLAVDIPVSESAAISAKGEYHKDSKKIIIRSSLQPVQKIKTLVHEYAHHLHFINHFEDESRSDREIVAESAAYVVCTQLGVDTSDYSFPYIRSWCEDPKQLKVLGSKVNKIAAEIISKLKGSELQESFSVKNLAK